MTYAIGPAIVAAGVNLRPGGNYEPKVLRFWHRAVPSKPLRPRVGDGKRRWALRNGWCFTLSKSVAVSMWRFVMPCGWAVWVRKRVAVSRAGFYLCSTTRRVCHDSGAGGTTGVRPGIFESRGSRRKPKETRMLGARAYSEAGRRASPDRCIHHCIDRCVVGLGVLWHLAHVILPGVAPPTECPLDELS
jgi:hypothetical protein